MPDTPPSLLDEFQADPERAWVRFAGLFAGRILGWARRWVGEADAEDVAHDVLVKLAPKLVTYRKVPGVPFHAWLKTVTRNECVDLLRERANHPPGPDGLSGVWDDDPADADAARDARELVRWGWELIRGEFDPAAEVVFVRVLLEERPRDAVAAELGVDVDRIYRTAYDIRRRLAEALDGLQD